MTGKDTKRFSTNIALRESYAVRYLLERFRAKLTRHFIFSPSVFKVMIDEQLFATELLHLIRAERNNTRKVGRLIDLLKYESISKFTKFLTVLRRSGHGWLAEELEEECRHSIGGAPSEDEDEEESLKGDDLGRSGKTAGEPAYANRENVGHGTIREIDYVSDHPDVEYQQPLNKSANERYLVHKIFRTGFEKGMRTTNRKGHQIAASQQLGNLMAHYDREKKYYHKKIRSLRSEEKGLKRLLNLNAIKQDQTRKKYDVINVMNREMEYVTAKNFRLGHFIHNI